VCHLASNIRKQPGKKTDFFPKYFQSVESAEEKPTDAEAGWIAHTFRNTAFQVVEGSCETVAFSAASGPVLASPRRL
jgi:hypothetical protein